jgi:uncharacterized protein (TIGR03067 family)
MTAKARLAVKKAQQLSYFTAPSGTAKGVGGSIMSISIQCPECEKKMNAKDDYAGRRVKCPDCGQSILVPESRRVSAGKPSRSSPAKSPAVRKAPRPSAPQAKRVRWPWYAGGAAGVSLVIVIVIFAMTGGDSNSATKTDENAQKKDDKREADPKPDPAASDRDLELLQGNWRARRVYWGPGNAEASAVDGGPVTIEGKQFRKKEFDSKGNLVDVVATISRIDATKKPKEIDFTMEAGTNKGKTIHLIYMVDDVAFEFFWPPVGESPPKDGWFFGRAGPFMWKDKGNLYQYVRAR